MAEISQIKLPNNSLYDIRQNSFPINTTLLSQDGSTVGFLAEKTFEEVSAQVSAPENKHPYLLFDVAGMFTAQMPYVGTISLGSGAGYAHLFTSSFILPENGDEVIVQGFALMLDNDAANTLLGNEGDPVEDLPAGLGIGSYIPMPTAITVENLQSQVNTWFDELNNKMNKNNPKGTGSFSLNRKANTTIGTNSFAEGYNTTASGDYTHAEGDGTTASGNCSHAEGADTIASGEYSHAEGVGTTASDFSAHAEGCNTVAGLYSHSEGLSTTASGSISHAEGDNTTASGSCSHAEGSNTTASGSVSHAEGDSTTASEYASHAEGYNSKASKNYSHAEGNSTNASGEASHAEGYNTTAKGEYSHAEGSKTIANGYGSHAEGSGYGEGTSEGTTVSYLAYPDFLDESVVLYSTQADGINSHAEGYRTYAYGDYSHSEGMETVAFGKHSHVEGKQSSATGNSAHAEGFKAEAKGQTSHAEGCYTLAHSEYQHVQGKYNIKDTSSNYSHIVGNGSSNANRSNAHTLDWDGNAWFQGDVYVGSTSGKNKDAGSKKLASESYVNEQVANLVNSAPAKLNTLDELAAALGDDENFANTVTTELSKKANTSDLNNYATKTALNAYQTKITGQEGQVVVINAAGQPVAQDISLEPICVFDIDEDGALFSTSSLPLLPTAEEGEF